MAVGAVYFYLIAYLIASFAVFGVMTILAGPDDTNQELGDYCGLAKESPFLGGVLACGLGSLAGIPPLAGFAAKLFVFVAAFKAGHFGLLAVAITGVVISIYYYFGWIRGGLLQRRVRDLAGGGAAGARRRRDDAPRRAGGAGRRDHRARVLPGSPGSAGLRTMKRPGPSARPVGRQPADAYRQCPSCQIQDPPR